MNTFEIQKGEVWAGSFFKRHWTRVSGLTVGSKFQWRLSLDMSNVPEGTTIKLCGISTASPFRYERLQGGIGQLASFTHEDSDRIIATSKQNDQIQLRAYAYRNGKGPATTGEGFSKPICEVPQRQSFEVQIDHSKNDTRYMVRRGNNTNSVFIDRDRPQGFLKHRTFAHAKGYKQPHSPGNIEIQAKVL